jgi:predicted ATPase
LATFDQQTLFGRQAELAALAALVTRVQAGEGVLAVLEGEAGFGKSHLTAAVARLAEAAGLHVIVAGSQSTAQRIAYFAARPLVRSLLGLAPEEDAQLAEIEHLRAVLAADSRRWAERAPLLGDVLGLPVPETPFSSGLTPRLRQQATVDLIVELIRRRAQARPLLIVLEDAHWLDEPTAAIAALLARTVAAAPVLLLVVTRPVSAGNHTGAGAFTEEWITANPAVRLVLGELAPAESAALMADRLGGPVDSLPAELIHTQAQGNPFFTEELTGALQEGGRLVERDGRWVLAEAVEQQLIAEHCLRWRDGRWHVVADAARIGAHLGLPDSIHGVVLARLDRLPEAAKLTLKVASVIGRLFEHELLLRAHPALPSAAEMERQMALFESREFARSISSSTTLPRRRSTAPCWPASNKSCMKPSPVRCKGCNRRRSIASPFIFVWPICNRPRTVLWRSLISSAQPTGRSGSTPMPRPWRGFSKRWNWRCAGPGCWAKCRRCTC